jgi:hypothetical protein
MGLAAANGLFAVWNLPIICDSIPLPVRGKERNGMKRDIWVFLFGLGVLLFNGPFLIIFHDSLTYYLFIIWFVFIGLIFLASNYSKREDGGR